LCRGVDGTMKGGEEDEKEGGVCIHGASRLTSLYTNISDEERRRKKRVVETDWSKRCARMPIVNERVLEQQGKQTRIYHGVRVDVESCGGDTEEE
jgi:hypothetical protein